MLLLRKLSVEFYTENTVSLEQHHSTFPGIEVIDGGEEIIVHSKHLKANFKFQVCFITRLKFP